MSRILITGSDGKIGLELIKILKEHELLLVDKKGRVSRKCNLVYDDLKFIKEFSPEIVIHLAASFERTDETREFIDINNEDNILATYRLNCLIGSLKTPPKQYIYASSYLVYDPYLYLSELPLKSARELSEVDEINPRNLIGAAKLYGESEINFIKRNFHKEMLVTHARIFRVYGDGGQEFISRILQWKKMGIPVDIWNPQNQFDYISTSDCASALKAMIGHGGIYNVGTGKSTSISEIIETVKPNIRTVENKDPFEMSCANIDKIREELGWEPKDNVIRWIKERL